MINNSNIKNKIGVYEEQKNEYREQKKNFEIIMIIIL